MIGIDGLSPTPRHSPSANGNIGSPNCVSMTAVQAASTCPCSSAAKLPSCPPAKIAS